MKKTLTTLVFIGFTSLCFAQKPLAWYNHTQLNVKNLDTSVAFYTKVFGFDTIPCPFPNSAKKIVKWLNVGENCQLHIIENVGDTTHIVFDGHLGINVRSLQEIKERLLKYSYGYQTGKLKIISEGKMPYGAKTASLQDPDGHLIHVIEDALQTVQKELRHVVLFKFKDGVSAESITAMPTAFKGLVNQIKECKKSEYGLNNTSDNLNQGFTHSFAITFASEEDRNTYLEHPEHGAFIKQFLPIIDKICMAAFWAERAK